MKPDHREDGARSLRVGGRIIFELSGVLPYASTTSDDEYDVVSVSSRHSTGAAGRLVPSALQV